MDVNPAPGQRPPSFLSARLEAKLRHDGYPNDIIERLESADFSDKRAESEPGWAALNERVHVAILLSSSHGEYDAALRLARTDWRDVLVNGGLANEGWREGLDHWFDHDEPPSCPR